jgi:hypothetical protein
MVVRRVSRKAAWMAGLALLASSAAAALAPPGLQSGEATAQQLDPLAPLDDPADASSVPAGASEVIGWVTASGDNNHLPFIVMDKVAAEIFVFDSTAQFIAASPALFGETAGDDSAPGVGDRELSAIPPADRTTPAGRFIAKFGRAAGNREVLWVDFPTAVSLHAVITTNKKQHRVARLESPTPADNRITFGCINVPTKFYADVVKPLFNDSAGVVYILPETRPLNAVFPALPAPRDTSSAP